MNNASCGNFKKRSALNSLTPWTLIQREVGSLFDDFLGEVQPVALFKDNSQKGFSPKIDLKETETEFSVKAELPGLTQEQVDVNLTEDALIIKGEKQQEREEKDEKNVRRYVERSYGTFQRIIPLSAEVDRDKVEASFKNGVLSIVLPKSIKAKNSTQKVTIKTE